MKPPASSPTQTARPALKGTIFIVTYGRSGSTVLQSILQTIPGAHITGENFGALFPLFQATQRIRRAKTVWGKKEQPANHPWFGADRLKPNRFANRVAELFIDEVIQPPKDARWIGFKEIRYPPSADAQMEPMLDFMRARFPNAHIVFNSRDAEKVAGSKWWGKRPPEEVKDMVRGLDARFAAYCEKWPEACFHAVHETTCAEPESLRPLFDQLGEPFDTAAVRMVLDTPLGH